MRAVRDAHARLDAHHGAGLDRRGCFQAFLIAAPRGTAGDDLRQEDHCLDTTYDHSQRETRERHRSDTEHAGHNVGGVPPHEPAQEGTDERERLHQVHHADRRRRHAGALGDGRGGIGEPPGRDREQADEAADGTGDAFQERARVERMGGPVLTGALRQVEMGDAGHHLLQQHAPLVVLDDHVARQRLHANAHALQPVQGVQDAAHEVGVALDAVQGDARLPPAAPAFRNHRRRHRRHDAHGNRRPCRRPIREAQRGEDRRLVGAGCIEGDEDVARDGICRGGAHAGQGPEVIFEGLLANAAPAGHVDPEPAAARMHDGEVLRHGGGLRTPTSGGALVPAVQTAGTSPAAR